MDCTDWGVFVQFSVDVCELTDSVIVTIFLFVNLKLCRPSQNSENVRKQYAVDNEAH